MNRRIRFFLSSLLLLAVLVGVPVLLTWRAVKQERLDQALITAVYNQNSDAVAALLKCGADANAKEHVGSPVSIQQVSVNLFTGFRCKDPTKDGATALWIAVERGDLATSTGHEVEIVRLLLDRGADVRHKDNAGQTVFELLNELERPDPQIVSLLQNKAASSNRRQQAGAKE